LISFREAAGIARVAEETH